MIQKQAEDLLRIRRRMTQLCGGCGERLSGRVGCPCPHCLRCTTDGDPVVGIGCACAREPVGATGALGATGP
jgi:hypothetical protein